ncbi:hypothetical protein BCV70DRAFT_201297 [Testicularia cyperi]|uniref:Uncharacterized protein n=1 Tax=Testicularia cyperi TaxID=1882483 RepID=A0A317XMH6_9BASI|nr:hypothetical protein BCV70DRAFT_201297 [Testicularia cyperi]
MPSPDSSAAAAKEPAPVSQTQQPSANGSADATAASLNPDSSTSALASAPTSEFAPNTTDAPPLVRRTSATQPPLRHGRKPIYPDSDAEAEGLDADVDDEELETGLHPGNGEHERSSLLGGTTRNGAATKGITNFDRAWLRISKLWGGDKAYSARLLKRRKQRRNTATVSSRRNSRDVGFSSRFAEWRHKHRYAMWTAYVFFTIKGLIVLFLFFAIGHLFLSTLKNPSPEAQSRILDESLLLEGPDRVQVLNISDDGILVRVDARLGLDPDHALDLWMGKRGKQGWWKNKERKLIEWAVGKVAGVQVDIGEVRLSELGAAWSQDVDLAPLSPYALSLPDPRDMLAFHLDPLVLPLPSLNRKLPDDQDQKDSKKHAPRPPILGNHSTPAAKHNMNPLNLTVLLKPVVPAPYIMEYAQHVIKKGKAQLDVKIASLRVRGLAKNEMGGISEGRKAGFFDVPRRIDISQRKIRSPVDEKVPKVNNDTDVDDLLKLDGFEFFEIGNDDDDGGDKHADGKRDDFVTAMVQRALGIKATAQAKNPLGKLLQGNVRYSLPFGVFLPVDGIAPPPGKNVSSTLEDADNSTDASVLMAAVATEPFMLTGQKKIDLKLMGRVVPPPEDSKPSSVRRDRAEGQLPLSSLSTGSDDAAIYAVDSTENGAATFVDGDNPQQAALSNFLSKFLRGEANTLFVRGGNPFRKPADGMAQSSKTDGKKAERGDDEEGEKDGDDGDDDDELPGAGSVLPGWMDSALRLLDVPISFPGSPVTELIKNVTINDLKITPHPFEKDKLLCSGTVMGEINMPGQLSTVDVKITHLWPDILVYDGKPPSMRHGKAIEDEAASAVASSSYSRFSLIDGALDAMKQFASTMSDGDDNDDDGDKPKEPEPEPAPPLPNPLPEKAFGRVRPYDFAPAETYIDPEDPKGERKLLRAVLKDVPFNVLPGRGPVFRSFTWKLITGQGALVGIEGSSRAKIWNSGLGVLQLKNLPVKGVFMLGKRD